MQLLLIVSQIFATLALTWILILTLPDPYIYLGPHTSELFNAVHALRVNCYRNASCGENNMITGRCKIAFFKKHTCW